jgi:hypothetical protein
MMLDTSKLKGPQSSHAIFLLNSLYRNGVAADLSQTGVGKTHVGSWLASQVNKPIVVVCPKMVIPKWEATLAEYGVKASVIINYELIVRGNTKWLKYDKKKNKDYRYLQTTLNFPPGSLVIIDESHKCKGNGSLNCGLLMALKSQGYMVLMLSATQATNPLEMRAFGYATNLHDGYTFKQFCVDAGAEYTDRYGGMSFNLDDSKALEKMGLVHTNLFDIQKIASRLTREQMGAYFPENQVLAECYDTGNDAKIAKVWEDMEYELIQLEETSANYKDHVFAIMTKARRHAELLKVPAMVEMAIDLYEEGKSVVLFVNYRETVTAIEERLEKHKPLASKVGFIIGGRAKQNTADVASFQANVLRILVANIAAGGVALDLHDTLGNHPRATILSPNFSAIQMDQALGRIHRNGGKTKCYQVIFYANVPIEQRMCKRVQSKLFNMSMLTDGEILEEIKYFQTHKSVLNTISI